MSSCRLASLRWARVTTSCWSGVSGPAYPSASVISRLSVTRTGERSSWVVMRRNFDLSRSRSASTRYDLAFSMAAAPWAAMACR